jgi:transposase
MSQDSIVRMANQIATFFATYPRPQAVEGTYDHIKKFWDPRMRKKLAEKVAAGGNRPGSRAQVFAPGSARGLNAIKRNARV